jgi:hypothetical protein
LISYARAAVALKIKGSILDWRRARCSKEAAVRWPLYALQIRIVLQKLAVASLSRVFVLKRNLHPSPMHVLLLFGVRSIGGKAFSLSLAPVFSSI